MSLCSELENINISVNYFCFIKEVFDDYMQYIYNYKVSTDEYLKKLSMLQDKFKQKLTGKDRDNTKYKNSKINHIFSLTSPIYKILEKQIENLQMLHEGIEQQLENNNKFMKEKEILSNKFQLMFEEARKDLLKKYREIDKLRDNYKTNMANTEDIISKYNNKRDNNTVTKDQMKNMITSTKKIEKEYKNLINSTKLYEETFDSLYLSSLENFKKLSSETSNQIKDSVVDFIVLFQNNAKMQTSEIELYLPGLTGLNEVKIMENIIVNSYKKNNKLIHVKPEKYILKIFQKKKDIEEGREEEDFLSPNSILNLEDGFEEMLLIKDENILKTIKIMKENFELFENKNLNIETEEEKIKSLKLTRKIFNIENPKLKDNIPKEQEIEELNALLDKHHNRVVFLQQLSEFRTSKFEISQKTFDIFSKLLNTMINTVQRDKDFHAIKNIIIISQTYYIKGEKEDDKTYLQKRIEKNEIFKSQTFWEAFLEFSINRAIVQSVNDDVKSGNILKENRKETEDKMGNLAFSQIVTYTDNMKEFGLDNETIEKVVFPVMERYKIDNESIESIKAIINNSNNK